MSPIVTALLFIDLRGSSPRQRTILRRELRQCGWTPSGSDDLVFMMDVNAANSDVEITNRATRNVHAAVDAAGISDWTADCLVAERCPQPA